LETVAGQVEALGSSARIHSVDVTKVDDIERVFQCIERIDVLVNCAGLNVPQPFLEVNPITFDRIWEVNVRATYFVAQAAAQRMVTNGKHGVIVNITSQMGHVGAALRSAYCTSKHAVEGMTKALAVELAPHGIRVVSIAPTFVRTSMTEQQLDDPNIGTKLLADIPIGRFGNPTEIAAAVVFAASKDAGLFTGSSLLLDGGWTAK
jgi:NAD(P)-dependent dehydrogenase (short-subunit alcohol dehydrogenase family)